MQPMHMLESCFNFMYTIDKCNGLHILQNGLWQDPHLSGPI